MKHRFAAGTLGTLAASLLFAYAPLAQAAQPAIKAAAPAPAVSAPQAKQQLQVLADQYYDALARFDPVNATESGDNRFDDQLGSSIVPAARAKQFVLYHQFQKRLRAIARQQLSQHDQINYDILDYELASALSFERFPEHLLPLNQMDSMPVTLANYAGGEGSQPLTTVKQYNAYLSRLGQLPAWIDQAIANMRVGMQKGIVLPRALTESALPQFKKLVSDTPQASVYYTPIKNLPASFSAADKERLTQTYTVIIQAKLMPALQRLATFMEKDYLPASRSSSGWSALPDGAAWYQARVASGTTTDMTPEQIHAIGLKEVARIQEQFAIVGPKMGYNGPASGLPTWVAAQAKYHPFKTDQEVLDVYRKLNVVLDTKLPALFTLVPKAPLDLRLEPELSRDTAADHYTAPAADGSRPGVFWSVVTDPKEYGSTGMTTLFLHEGKPGHHFHLALVQEMDLPNFRRFGGNNAFTEGWALYAETLGKEMGLYDDPAQYFGHLNDEMLRAVRLVVDTGLHTKGWTREQTIQYMRETLGYDAVAKSETERYMAWPGQALGYKIGALKILELRQRAQQALGDKFSLPKFHEVVLSDGTLPLKLLEAKVDRWITQQKQS
ncbi:MULTISPECIES: DUF885 family protein [unclassified Janthinobacterium]|uniref:DUF885 domain-containing protein n=1 Tax=unclassified Janthinobacterium TaxID=2610881 RepID=UPI0016206BF0|nr:MULTISPECIES: DUF885 domain-containing protein [unclassified Janthinobacterium]MBB5371724.1 uncharacterized protein (DUF885 family) [Janthinobacterium sp. K2C7]MBB5384529.1 uncharacterized protein (DUF885 family) [Janthinobacterium sp. K2Li3]MBB5389805.1 uncharacterized protein (DUF885 family) [Janthinobacterium sp. K2E3]